MNIQEFLQAGYTIEEDASKVIVFGYPSTTNANSVEDYIMNGGEIIDEWFTDADPAYLIRDKNLSIVEDSMSLSDLEDYISEMETEE